MFLRNLGHPLLASLRVSSCLPPSSVCPSPPAAWLASSPVPLVSSVSKWKIWKSFSYQCCYRLFFLFLLVLFLLIFSLHLVLLLLKSPLKLLFFFSFFSLDLNIKHGELFDKLIQPRHHVSSWLPFVLSVQAHIFFSLLLDLVCLYSTGEISINLFKLIIY